MISCGCAYAQTQFAQYILIKAARKSFQLHACLTSPRHARLRAPNGFLMKVKRAQLNGNENAV